VVGTYPILKGVSSPLEAGDITVSVPVMLAFSPELSCFFVTNPGKGLSDASKFLEKSKNLSDIPDKAEARKNLGIPDCPYLVGDVIFRANNVSSVTSYPGTTWTDLNANYGSSNIMIGGIPVNHWRQ
jgi:hypothetical protein